MKWHVQLSRYTLVGLVSNAIGYLLYLLVTEYGLGHKTAMTLLFVVGILQTFLFNKRWTFGHQGFFQASLVKYFSVYSLAYLFNLAALLVFVDRLGLPHQIVQGVMIVALALMLFLAQKCWVFRVPKVA